MTPSRAGQLLQNGDLAFVRWLIGSSLSLQAKSIESIIEKGVFRTWHRLPGRESPREPIPDLAPDLAVEVLGEGNTKSEMARKVREYFEAGVVMVWLIDPKKRTARVYSNVEKSVLVRADQALDGGDVLPGFVIRLSDLLDRGRRPRRG